MKRNKMILIGVAAAILLLGCAPSPKQTFASRPTVENIQKLLSKVHPGMTEEEAVRILRLGNYPFPATTGLTASKMVEYDLGPEEPPRYTLMLNYSFSAPDKTMRLINAEIHTNEWKTMSTEPSSGDSSTRADAGLEPPQK